jgi:DNA-binding NtrC family response regulator
MAKTILIVDDDAGVLEGLPPVLASRGVEVATARSADEARSVVKSRSVDLVITDLCLRGRSDNEGLELVSWVKKASPLTEVVLITGFGSTEIRDEAMERGAVDYWEKTISIPDLVQRVRNLGIPAGTPGATPLVR